MCSVLSNCRIFCILYLTELSKQTDFNEICDTKKRDTLLGMPLFFEYHNDMDSAAFRVVSSIEGRAE